MGFLHLKYFSWIHLSFKIPYKKEFWRSDLPFSCIKIPKLEILVFLCHPFSLFTSFKFRHQWRPMSTNPYLVSANEIVDALYFRKSRARDCLHALSLAEANYDNMRYYGDLIVFFKIYFVQKGIIISILYRYSLEGNGLDYQKVQAHLKNT